MFPAAFFLGDVSRWVDFFIFTAIAAQFQSPIAADLTRASCSNFPSTLHSIAPPSIPERFFVDSPQQMALGADASRRDHAPTSVEARVTEIIVASVAAKTRQKSFTQIASLFDHGARATPKFARGVAHPLVRTANEDEHVFRGAENRTRGNKSARVTLASWRRTAGSRTTLGRAEAERAWLCSGPETGSSTRQSLTGPQAKGGPKGDPKGLKGGPERSTLKKRKKRKFEAPLSCNGPSWGPLHP